MTGSQCSSRRIGVIWSYFWERVTNLAAEFWILWSLVICDSSRPYSRLLHWSKRHVIKATHWFPVVRCSQPLTPVKMMPDQLIMFFCCCFVLLFLHLFEILKMLFFSITWFVTKNVPKFVLCIKNWPHFSLSKVYLFWSSPWMAPIPGKILVWALSSCWLSLSLPKLLPMCDPSSPPPVCNSSAIFHCICVQDQQVEVCSVKWSSKSGG